MESAESTIPEEVKERPKGADSDSEACISGDERPHYLTISPSSGSKKASPTTRSYSMLEPQFTSDGQSSSDLLNLHSETNPQTPPQSPKRQTPEESENHFHSFVEARFKRSEEFVALPLTKRRSWIPKSTQPKKYISVENMVSGASLPPLVTAEKERKEQPSNTDERHYNSNYIPRSAQAQAVKKNYKHDSTDLPPAFKSTRRFRYPVRSQSMTEVSSSTTRYESRYPRRKPITLDDIIDDKSLPEKPRYGQPDGSVAATSTNREASTGPPTPPTSRSVSSKMTYSEKSGSRGPTTENRTVSDSKAGKGAPDDAIQGNPEQLADSPMEVSANVRDLQMENNSTGSPIDFLSLQEGGRDLSDVVTYNTLLQETSSSSHPDKAQHALNMLATMKRNGVDPNEGTWSLIEQCNGIRQDDTDAGQRNKKESDETKELQKLSLYSESSISNSGRSITGSNWKMDQDWSQLPPAFHSCGLLAMLTKEQGFVQASQPNFSTKNKPSRTANFQKSVSAPMEKIMGHGKASQPSASLHIPSGITSLQVPSGIDAPNAKSRTDQVSEPPQVDQITQSGRVRYERPADYVANPPTRKKGRWLPKSSISDMTPKLPASLDSNDHTSHHDGDPKSAKSQTDQIPGPRKEGVFIKSGVVQYERPVVYLAKSPSKRKGWLPKSTISDIPPQAPVADSKEYSSLDGDLKPVKDSNFLAKSSASDFPPRPPPALDTKDHPPRDSNIQLVKDGEFLVSKSPSLFEPESIGNREEVALVGSMKKTERISQPESILRNATIPPPPRAEGFFLRHGEVQYMRPDGIWSSPTRYWKEKPEIAIDNYAILLSLDSGLQNALDLASYNVLLRTIAESDLDDKAKRAGNVLKAMKEKGVEPSDTTRILLAQCSIKYFQEGREMLKKNSNSIKATNSDDELSTPGGIVRKKVRFSDMNTTRIIRRRRSISAMEQGFDPLTPPKRVSEPVDLAPGRFSSGLRDNRPAYPRRRESMSSVRSDRRSEGSPSDNDGSYSSSSESELFRLPFMDEAPPQPKVVESRGTGIMRAPGRRGGDDAPKVPSRGNDTPKPPPRRAGGDTPKIPRRKETPRKSHFDPDLQRTAAPFRGKHKRRSSISGIERRKDPLTPPRRFTSTIDCDTARKVLLQIELLLDVESESAQPKTDTFDVLKEPENDGSEKSRRYSPIKPSKKHSRRDKSNILAPPLRKNDSTEEFAHGASSASGMERIPWRLIHLPDKARVQPSADKAHAEEAVREPAMDIEPSAPAFSSLPQKGKELEERPPIKPSDVELQKEIELPEVIERRSLSSMDRPSHRLAMNASTEMLKPPRRRNSAGVTPAPERRNYEELKSAEDRKLRYVQSPSPRRIPRRILPSVATGVNVKLKPTLQGDAIKKGGH
jgi:hypothetical protein